MVEQDPSQLQSPRPPGEEEEDPYRPPSPPPMPLLLEAGARLQEPGRGKPIWMPGALATAPEETVPAICASADLKKLFTSFEKSTDACTRTEKSVY